MTNKIKKAPSELRSRQWFDDPEDAGMTALYLERYLNFGLTREELQSGRPLIGIAQTGSDLSPCNRHHVTLAERVKDGIREPCHHYDKQDADVHVGEHWKFVLSWWRDLFLALFMH